MVSNDTRVTGPLVQTDPQASDHGSTDSDGLESEADDETWCVIMCLVQKISSKTPYLWCRTPRLELGMSYLHEDGSSSLSDTSDDSDGTEESDEEDE